MRRVTFTSASAEKCQLIYGEGLLDKLPESLKILDSGLRKALGIKLKDEYLLPGGEHVKAIDRVFEIYQLIRTSPSKRLAAIGGGSIIDVVGFAASTHSYISELVVLPSTTVSQVMPALNGFSINFEFVKDLLHSEGLPSKVFVDSGLTYGSVAGSSMSEILFPLLVALSFDSRLFRYIHNHISSGSTVSEELWADIVYSASAAYTKAAGERKAAVGSEMAKAIQTASRLRTDYSTALIHGAISELSLARSYGLLTGSQESDFVSVVGMLWRKERSLRIDFSSLVDIVNNRGGIRINLPETSRDTSCLVMAGDFEKTVRERPWMGLGGL